MNEKVTWSLRAGAVPRAERGTLSNETATSATYTAASSVSAQRQVIVVATSAADNTSAAIPVFINPAMQVGTGIGNDLSSNPSCQYDLTHGINNGTVGQTYQLSGASGAPPVLGGTPPYAWSITGGSLPPGLSLSSGRKPPSFSSAAFLFGTPITPGCSQVVLQVQDGTGATTKSKTYNIIIVPPALKIQVPNYADPFSGVPYPPSAFSVTGGTPPYSWSARADDQMPAGLSLNPVAQNTAAAFISGTPAGSDSFANGSPYTPTLQVVDSETPYPAISSVRLNLFQWPALSSPCTPPANVVPNNTNLEGSYAFLLRGFDADGPVVIAGSFTADGAGNVTGGVEDIMRTAGSQTNLPIVPAGSSYSIFLQVDSGANSTAQFRQRGCVALANSTGASNTFAFSMGGCSTSADPNNGGDCVATANGVPGVFTTGRLIEFDDTTGSGTRASGMIRLQDTSTFSTGLSGLYAFGFSGWDSRGNRYAAGGSFNASSGAVSAAAADINDGGALQSALTGGSGSYNIDPTNGPTNGRWTAKLAVGTASYNLAAYVVSAKEVMLASIGPPSAANPFVSGEAIGTAGPFRPASLQNSHIFHLAGLARSGPDPSVGILKFDGISTFSGTQFEDQAGTLGTTSLSGNYTVNSNTGRVAFAASIDQNLGTHPLVGYAIPAPSRLQRQSCVKPAECVTGFLLSTDATAQAGLLEFQTPSAAPPPPFSSLYAAGYYFYGTDESLDAGTPLFEGAAFANPNNANYSGVQSASYPGPIHSPYCQELQPLQLQPLCALPNEPLTAAGGISVKSDGAVAVGGETVAVTNGNVIFYIDESPLNSHPSVMVIEQ